MTRLGTAFALALVTGCGQNERLVGNGSETTTGISARVIGADGSPVVGATVQIRPTNWIPDSLGGDDPARQVLTNLDGVADLGSVGGGAWTVVATGPDGMALGRFEKGDSQATGTLDLRLAPTSTLRGKIDVPDGNHAWIAIAGLPGGVHPDASGSFSFGGLPAGQLTLQVSANGDSLRRCAKSVETLPGTNSDAGTLAPATRHAGKAATDSVIAEIDLGANRPDTLVGYPLLVRLSDTSIDFTKTRGTDLRISRTGTPLAHQVERWDPVDRSAAIWVRVDTLLPSDRKLSIRIGYGGSDPTDWSDSRSVFPRAEGWVAAWHLDAADPGAEATGSHRATDWRTIDAVGIAGRGRYCDTGWLRIHDAPDLHLQDMTLSCWARRRGNQIPTGKLISKGNMEDWHNTWALQAFDKTYRLGFLTLRTDSLSDTLRAPALADNSWTFVAATWNAGTGRQVLYYDGVAVDSSMQPRSLDYANTPAIDMHLFLGANFIGALDEVRISNRARPPSWIALDARTQEPGSNAVRFFKQP